MILAAYYTTHNTLVAMLIFLAALALVALVVRQARLRRHRELPFGIRPITLHRGPTWDTTNDRVYMRDDGRWKPLDPPVMRYEMAEVPRDMRAEYAYELGQQLQGQPLQDMSRTLLGPPRMINAWDDLMEADWL